MPPDEIGPEPRSGADQLAKADTESSGSLTFADQLDALGDRDGEFVSVCRRKPGGAFVRRSCLPRWHRLTPKH
jgi:hypothetical protein